METIGKTISAKDRERLRSLAHRQQEYANSRRNEEILEQWKALGEGRKEAPTVRLRCSSILGEM